LKRIEQVNSEPNIATGDTAALRRVLDEHRPTRGRPANILGTLLAIQKALGHVPGAAIGTIADALNVPEAHVAGVLSYYPDLHSRPTGRHVIRVCLGEACVANRSQQLLAELQRILGIQLGETSGDGGTTLVRVYCLGNCGVGPTVMVDDTIYGRLSASDVQNIISPGGA
jgi:formate dehydrogenase subunit gamma